MGKKEEIVLADDGLIAPVVGPWSEEKYRLISYYAALFSKGMKSSWQSRVYIDLYAGAGRAKIKEANRFVDTSPILALKVEKPFDRYIFCDLNKEKLDALYARAQRIDPAADVRLVHGDANLSVAEILNVVPQHRSGFNVISFCVIDPFNTGDFAFETIASLTKKYMDIFILLPTCMDAKRNLHNYYDADNVQIDKFLGDVDWRQKWGIFRSKDDDFAHFIVSRFVEKMVDLKFLDSGQHVKPVYYQEGGKKVLLYHLAFFSKHQKGLEFWKKSLSGTTPQTSFLGDL